MNALYKFTISYLWLVEDEFKMTAVWSDTYIGNSSGSRLCSSGWPLL